MKKLRIALILAAALWAGVLLTDGQRWAQGETIDLLGFDLTVWHQPKAEVFLSYQRHNLLHLGGN